MKCPSCGNPESKVIDSRPSNEGDFIRRRRECLACQKRFTTYETIESLPIVVVKKDGSRESFDRNKLLRSIIRACEKRQITQEQMVQCVDEIETVLQSSLQNEVQSSDIGLLVMSKLKSLDEVAYVRFASVYRRFKDINDFMDELKRMLAER